MEGERIVAGLHCGEVLADLSEHLDGRLGFDRAGRIDEHLAGCAECGRLLGEITAAVRALRQLPEEPLPSEIEALLLEALRDEAPLG